MNAPLMTTVAAVLFGLALTVFLVFPLLLALWYSVVGFGKAHFKTSQLFVGRVWHTRFQPKRHAFTYPIFMFALDLEEVTQTSGRFLLWPLVQFWESDHLKNGEGKLPHQGSGANISSCGGANRCSLPERIIRLIAERTDEKCKPTLRTHRVVLLTHLTYYGYNFNPVSFYYVVDRDTSRITAMVGEVSNTPWLEMYPYVLHADSQDKVKCSSTGNKYAYTFPKTFHVSPFMEMDYFYDWIMAGVPTKDSSLTIVNSLRKRTLLTDGKDDSISKLAFTAKLVLEAHEITPMAVALQLIQFPVFCMIIQIWIHYEAAWLFLKGIVYVPHPLGTETMASRVIATVMVPFFAIRDRLKPSSATPPTVTKKSQ